MTAHRTSKQMSMLLVKPQMSKIFHSQRLQDQTPEAPAHIPSFRIPWVHMHTPVQSWGWLVPWDCTRVSLTLQFSPRAGTANQLIGGLSPGTSPELASPVYKDIPWRFPRAHLCKWGTHHLLSRRISGWDNGWHVFYPLKHISCAKVACSETVRQFAFMNCHWKSVALCVLPLLSLMQ